MQTFLPYHDIKQSVKVLDRQRLGKQRVEGMQILHTLIGVSDGWSNHPAVLMWKGHEAALCKYTIECCNEWTRRGYVDNIKPRVMSILEYCFQSNDTLPDYFDDEFHLSHQSNLVRKDPIHYGAFFKVNPDLPYKWPVQTNA